MNASHITSVNDFYNPTNKLPNGCVIGTKFLSSQTGNGWTIGRIYENEENNEWIEIIPNRGHIIYVQSTQLTYIYDGITWNTLDTTINHNHLINSGHNSHQLIDAHINNKKLHTSEKDISHKNIRDVGLYTHDNIDRHIGNSTNAHFGQDLTQHGDPIFNSIRINEITKASNVVSKSYVDQKVFGLEWNKPIKTLCDNIPTDAIEGERHIMLKTFDKWKENYIYEYQKNKWTEIYPTRNYAVYVTDGLMYKGDVIVFNGFEWVQFGSTMDHTSLNNAGIHSHKEIDEHICDDKYAHFGQDLRVTGAPSFYDMTIRNKLDTFEIKSNKIIETKKLKIGDVNIPKSFDDMSNFIIVSDNEQLNEIHMCADVSSSDPINTIYARSRGSIYQPEGLLCGTQIGMTTYSGHDGDAYRVASSIGCITTEDFTQTKHGSSLFFSTTENGTELPKINLMINHDGSLTNYCAIESDNIYQGAIITHGGMSVHKNLSVGGNVQMCNNLCFNNTSKKSLIVNNRFGTNDDKILSICGGEREHTKYGGFISLSGNESIQDGTIKIMAGIPNGCIEMGTNNETQFEIDKKGKCIFKNSENVVINGGLNIGKDLYVGGNNMILDTTEFNINVHSHDENDKTKLCICGGNDGGNIQLFSKQNGEMSGCVVIDTGKSVNGKVIFSNNLIKSCEITNDGVIHVLNTIESVNHTTGSLIIDGGVSINKSLSVENVKCWNSIQLPLFSKEPDGAMGMMYYDTLENKLRIFTNIGWKTIKYE